MFVDVSVAVAYDNNSTNKSAAQLQIEVANAITAFQDTNLNDFNKTLRQSKLGAYLDALDISIVSSDIIAKPIIEYVPALDIASSPSFTFETALVQPYAFDATTGFTSFVSALKSTQFTVDSTPVIIQDDGIGNLMLVTDNSDVPTVFKSSVGTINYTTGAVSLINLNVSSYVGKAIKFTVSSVNKDVKPPKDRIITIRAEDVTVTATPLVV